MPSARPALWAACAGLAWTAPSAHAQPETDPAPALASAGLDAEMLVGPNTGNQPRPRPAPGDEQPALPDQPASPFHLRFALDLTTAYYSRGLYCENAGLILQPAADLTFEALGDDDFTLSLTGGVWESFHSANTLSTTRNAITETWYESDAYLGLALATGPWSFEARYYTYASPNGAFGTIEEVYLSAAYATDDQEDWLSRLAPTALLAIETGPNAIDGLRRGTYLQLGVGPGFEVEEGPLAGVAFEFPVSVGLSLSNYYEGTGGENDAFGFVSLGAGASIPLWEDCNCGDWSLTVGVQGLFLGDAAATINGGNDAEVIGTLGLAVEF